MTKVGILYSRVRAEEKLLFAAFEQRGVDFDAAGRPGAGL